MSWFHRALYPDVILRDLLAATTHPNEIVAANQWAMKSDLAGSLSRTGYSDRWDESVKAHDGVSRFAPAPHCRHELDSQTGAPHMHRNHPT
jgi:hypothetical protein